MKSAWTQALAQSRAAIDPIVDRNPVMVQILGLCSTLAVTSALRPAILMGLGVTAVVVFTNAGVSLLRSVMPQSIRLIVEMTLIATAVIVVDQVLRAYAPDVSAVLSIFVGLIITNCIVLGRAEAFAIQNGVWDSVLDGLGNGLGYTWVLVLIGAVRELLGAGTLLGHRVLPVLADGGWFRPNQLMLLSPSALFLIGLLIWFVNSRRAHGVAASTAARPAHEEA